MITQDRLKEVLLYNHETGIFTWRKTMSNRASAGTQAGWSHNAGYVGIRIDGKAYLAHRLAWLYVTGEWPPILVDHRDTVKTNNKFSNLRLANHSQNSENCKISKDNKTGYKGVTFNKQLGKFIARIRKNKIEHHLGCYETPELAHVAYVEASARLHGEFGHV